MRRKKKSPPGAISRLLTRFFPRKASRPRSNSDLLQHKYGPDPEPRQKRKGLSVRSWRSRMLQKRQIRQEGYRTKSPKIKRGWLKDCAMAIVLVAIVLSFVMFNGAAKIGTLLGKISFFQVHALVINGCEASSRERLRVLSGVVPFNTSMIGMDVASIAAKLATDPRVSQVEVNRAWPSTVNVQVTERRPIALVNTVNAKESKLYYIDSKGVQFLPATVGQDLDFPVITGLESIAEPKEKEAIFTEILVFLNKAARNDPNLPAQSVSEIRINEKGELIIFLVDHPFPIFFGRGETAVKYSRLVRVLESLYKKNDSGVDISQVEYIRMDYLNDKVLVAQTKSG